MKCENCNNEIKDPLILSVEVEEINAKSKAIGMFVLGILVGIVITIVILEIVL